MLPTGSYDKFFAGRFRVTGLQFWGLILLGMSFVSGGCFLLVMMVWKVSADPWDGWKVIILFVPAAIFCSIIYFGILHIKRAFAGRR
jgi:hypothetical protein